jgi:hypothetical protein
MRISVLGAWVMLGCWLRVVPCVAAGALPGTEVPEGLGTHTLEGVVFGGRNLFFGRWTTR